MKTFTNYAEKKAKQFLNLLQGYTKSIRLTAILILLLMGVSEAHAWGWVKYESTSPATIYPGDKVEIQMLLNVDANGASYKRFGYGTTNSKAGLTWSKNYNWIENVGNDNRWKFNFTPTSATTYYWSLWIGWGNSVGDNGRYYKTEDWNEGSESYQSASVTVNAVPKVKAFTATAQSTSNIALSWTKNSLNDDVLIVQGSSTAPTQGTSYSDGSTIGTGKVVYKGSATSTTITGLSASTSYTFYIYSIHNSKYYSASTSASATTTKTPTYTVTFNANGHGTAPAAQTVTQGSKATTPAAPTATGYTFGGWHKEANCTNAFDFNTAITADITLYAKWTINQYTLTYSAGEGGTVSGSPASGTKIDYNTSITLTANPAEGNILTQWVNENGTFVSSANPYTFKITKNTTLKAEFAKPSTVYLNVRSFWADANARYAIYAWADGKTNQWVEMQPVDCEKQYYSANIPTGYSDFKYVRLNPEGKGDANRNDGLDWYYKWHETGDLKYTGEDKNLHITPRFYLKPSEAWKKDNARFAAYFFTNDKSEWVSMTPVKGEDGVYQVDVPAFEYQQVVICRMNPGTNENNFNDGVKWDQTGDLTIYTGNIYDQATGTWSSHLETFAPTYTVTLKSSSYGLFSVACNGNTYHSNYKTDVVVNDVPYGAQVQIYDIMPNDSAVYNEDMLVKRSSSGSFERYTDNKTFTVCGNTTIQEDFVTKEDVVVYLGVPNNLTENKDKYGKTHWILKKFIWAKNGSGYEPLIESEDSIQIGTVIFHKITIPAGINKFAFQSKQQGGPTETQCESIWFYRSIPTNNVNCFTLKNEKDGSYYKGDWTQLPASNGDFRVLYVEQQVAKEDWKTVINTTYQHSSDFIRKNVGGTDIVSLHVKRNEELNPEIILQQMKNDVWVDLERHMVMGPLQTDNAGAAMLPGRRNAAGNLIYDDGIEVIKNDGTYPGRVYNFKVQQFTSTATKADTAQLLLDVENLKPYSDDDYYIRTDNAVGGWICYNQPKNVMSYSEYSLTHSGYSHYFCKWVETSNKPNTKFVVANKYGAAISDTIVADDYTDGNGTLTANANVRWMWNEYTNDGSRAYIAGSTEPNFLTATYANTTTVTFEDKGEWVYEKDLEQVQVGDVLNAITANYAGKEPQQLLEETYQENGLVMLESAGDARVSSYTVRVVYDFKINQTLCYLIPTGNAVTTSIDVIIERINQDEGGNATQVKATITPADKEKGLTVYGVITLTKDHITDPTKSEQEALTYWISFPFDVNIADISGFGEHGKDWILRKYNGKKRAEIGWFLDTKTFWERISEGTLDANTGYVLALHTRMLNASCPLYENTSTLKLYFPSKDKITDDITSGLTQKTCTIPTHTCTITQPLNRETEDSNWNLIGVPSFADQNKTTTNDNIKYFYDYNFANDKYNTEKNTGEKTFKPMHAYMVQFGGVIDWSTFSFTENGGQQLAARKNTSLESHTLRLELQQNGVKADQTFVELQEEGATEMFDMNIDLTKMFNAGANIYTIIGESKTEAAANVLPIANTTIPVGVQIAKAGEYTFAMPDGTEGIVVELIDYETNTTTNLMLDEYTVNLAAGTNESRFALSVKPDKTTTSLEDININSNGVKKYLIDGVLYLQKDGLLYDAQGKLVR